MPLKPILFENDGFAFVSDEAWFALTPTVDTSTYEMFTFGFLSNGKRLEHAVGRVEKFVRALLGEGEYVDLFVIAVSELLSNIVRHSKKNHRATVHVLHIPGHALLVSAVDKAGPLLIQQVNTTTDLADGLLNLEDHGRGFFIMTQGSDVVAYLPDADAKMKEILLGLNLLRRKQHAAG